ncbi:hypothetical protein SHLA_28c000080 [Shinella sp. DD12]|jgi:predicted transcriptional regulator|nr:hypothetical protein SHLA_28c000080 [Shinella sp. DD12]
MTDKRTPRVESHEDWQLAEIEAGLAEADDGAFASEEDVAKVVGKYVKPHEQKE